MSPVNPNKLIPGQTRDCIHGHLARSCELCEMENEIEDLKRTVVKAAIPLEVLHGLGNSWRHPLLRRRWNQMVTEDLRRGIEEAVHATRSAL